jgi:hypothetical protein
MEICLSQNGSWPDWLQQKLHQYDSWAGTARILNFKCMSTILRWLTACVQTIRSPKELTLAVRNNLATCCPHPLIKARNCLCKERLSLDRTQVIVGGSGGRHTKVLLLDRCWGRICICNLLDSTAATIIHILKIIKHKAVTVRRHEREAVVLVKHQNTTWNGPYSERMAVTYNWVNHGKTWL